MKDAPPRARKRFGQHFLHDEAVIDRIVRAVCPKADAPVVEIGPGRGALTGALLAACGRLTVIEIDRDLVPLLRRDFADAPQFEVIEADVLTVDFRALAERHGLLRLCGNLPYNISTPLLFHLLAAADGIGDMTFMLQQEVVDRMCAAPGSRAYGRLSVTLAARASAEALFTVGPESFTPPPKVQSAVVRIVPRPPAFPITDLPTFDRVVTQAFGKRRKTLANGLRGLLDAEQIQNAGIDPGLRPEVLSPAQFAALANSLT